MSIAATPLVQRIDHARVVRQFRVPRDPTTVTSAHDLWRATLTPDGPGTVHVRWSADREVSVDQWGPGGAWLASRVPGMIGLTDTRVSVTGVHPAVDRAEHDLPFLRIARSGTVYHDLLPTILAQRITGLEAADQWRRLCWTLGAAAPGPHPSLRLPPSPAELLAKPTWWYHRFGIERRRADTLRTVARYANRLLPLGAPEHAKGVTDGAEIHRWMQLLPGVGRWTAGVVAGTALGHPDEIPVGDFHLKNSITYALTGRHRGTDDEMLELLSPFAGQRNRVVHLLLAAGWSAPAHGPRRRTVAVARL